MTDTPAKRLSAVHVGSPWRTASPLPDGTIGQADRQAAGGYYSGILADVPVTPSIFPDLCPTPTIVGKPLTIEFVGKPLTIAIIKTCEGDYQTIVTDAFLGITDDAESLLVTDASMET